LPEIPTRNTANRSYKRKTGNREVQRVIAERPRNMISTGNSRELKRYSWTRKCKTEALVLRLPKEKRGKRGRKPKELLAFPFFLCYTKLRV
jgi:hypothetical protein